MKLKIESDGGGWIRIELTTDPAKKPIVHSIHHSAVPGIVKMLEAAAKANKFTVSLEL